ncbi:MAG TPA: superoxide dismutase [Cu-Zn] SodC [Gammaproteobacteria bacterium]|nr:superoxide dismutase [Cu-Zn] SodC [Gammaproteobacteria bacterium]
MKIIFILILSVLLGACKPQEQEKSVEVKMYTATPEGQGEYVGTVSIKESAYGLIFTPHLQHLPAGLHGFHLHEKANCAPALKDNVVTPALTAGGHFDPQKTKRHEGPYGMGHLGDLPALYVDNNGDAQTPVLAPRLLTLHAINNTALMIHLGGDNYSDHPHDLGGGGARIVCGVIQLSSQ